MPRKRSFWNPGPWRPSYRSYKPPSLFSSKPRRHRRASVKIRFPKVRIAQPRRRRSGFGRFMRSLAHAQRAAPSTVFFYPPTVPVPPPMAPAMPAQLSWSPATQGHWDNPLAWIPDAPPYVDTSQLLVWWVADPRDQQGCCEDCRAVATASPYTPPWIQGGKQLMMSPGDGRCRCGAGCTCHLSYVPPQWIYWPPLSTLPPIQQHMLVTPWEVQKAEHG